jgi:hypothetical protein
MKNIANNPYADLALSPESWITTARQLLACAKQLEPKLKAKWIEPFDENPNSHRSKLRSMHFHQVYLLLFAYAIENIIKSGYVKKYQSKLYNEILNSNNLPKELKSHNLVSLLNKLGIKPTLQIEEHLRRLTIHSTWIGRYPVPLKRDEHKFTGTLSDGTISHLATWNYSDMQHLWFVVDYICDKLGIDLNPEDIEAA